LTDLLNAVVAVAFAGALNVGIWLYLRMRAGLAEPAFVTRIYLGTLGLRWLLAFGLNLLASNSTWAATFWGDSGTYDAAGDLLARQWLGEGTSTFMVSAVSGYGFVYYVAAIYYAFGRNQILVQLLNATVGSLTMVVVYLIGQRLFGARVARVAALFMAFFPQMVFWSAGMYKDPAVQLCIALSMLAVLRLREGFSLRMMTLLIAATLGLITLRFYIFYFVALAALGTFAFGRRGGLVPRLVTYSLVAIVFLGVVSVAVKRETLELQRAFLTLDQLQVTRADQAATGQSAFGTEYDVSTVDGAIRALPTGLAYLLFAPFPWALSGVRQLLTLPETLVWYALMPAFARGLAHAVRWRLRDVLPILVFATTLTLAYALMQGNMGTAYRQRTQVTMFFFVFMAVGIVQKSRRPARRPIQPTLAQATAGLAASVIGDHDFTFEHPAEVARPEPAAAGSDKAAKLARTASRAFVPEPPLGGDKKTPVPNRRRR